MIRQSRETWGNIFRNLAELDEEVEVAWLDGTSEWVLCHGTELFEDGFETEREAEARLEHVTKVIDIEPVASITISNTGGVLIYEAEMDYVLAGVNGEVPEYYEIDFSVDDEEDSVDAFFMMGEWKLSLGDAMRF